VIRENEAADVRREHPPYQVSRFTEPAQPDQPSRLQETEGERRESLAVVFGSIGKVKVSACLICRVAVKLAVFALCGVDVEWMVIFPSLPRLAKSVSLAEQHARPVSPFFCVQLSPSAGQVIPHHRDGQPRQEKVEETIKA